MRNVLIALLLASFLQHAAEASENQPAKALRPLSPDRPSVTNGTQTVDQGHFQLEMDIVSYLTDPKTYTFGTANFKVGVLDNVDFQFIWTPWVHTGGETMPSNLTIRSKINFWGNDGETATSAQGKTKRSSSCSRRPTKCTCSEKPSPALSTMRRCSASPR